MGLKNNLERDHTLDVNYNVNRTEIQSNWRCYKNVDITNSHNKEPDHRLLTVVIPLF